MLGNMLRYLLKIFILNLDLLYTMHALTLVTLHCNIILKNWNETRQDAQAKK